MNLYTLAKSKVNKATFICLLLFILSLSNSYGQSFNWHFNSNAGEIWGVDKDNNSSSEDFIWIVDQNSWTNGSNTEKMRLGASSLKLNVPIHLNDNALYLRSDNFHALRYCGSGSTFAGVNLDGPVLYGTNGGGLGSNFLDNNKITIRWNSDGNVGIGTSSPSIKLDILGDGSAGAFGTKNNSNWDHVYIYHDGATAFFRAGGAETGLALQVGTGVSGSYGGQTYAEAMRLLSNGNVGIGTTSPGYKLSVAGSGHSFNVNPHVSGVDLYSTGNFAPHYQTDFTVYKGVPGSGSGKFTINTDGNVGIGTTSPGTKLEVAGQVKITGGAPGVGKVLTSDASGLATWTLPASTLWTATGNNIYYSPGNVGIGVTNPAFKLDVNGDFSLRNATSSVLWSSRADSDFDLIQSDNSTRRAFTIHAGNTGANVVEIYSKQSNEYQPALFVTNGAGNVGIGTGAPTQKLDVNGNSNFSGFIRINSNDNIYLNSDENHGLGYYGGSKLFAGTSIDGPVLFGYTGGALGNLNGNTIALRWDADGDVGIGTTSPAYKLDVNGNMKVNNEIVLRSGDDLKGLLWNSSATESRIDDYEGKLSLLTDDSFVIGEIDGTTGAPTGQYVLSADVTTGSVGIGVTSDKFEPNCTLSINGPTYIGDFGAGYNTDFVRDSLIDSYYLWVEKGIVSEDFAIAEVTEWDDYVFNEDYQLPSLTETAAFIKANKHLPNIPSEAEVKKDGYSLHKLNRGLLKTIEEQTLHAIQQEKKISTLENKVSELEAALNQYQQLAAEVAALKALVLETAAKK